MLEILEGRCLKHELAAPTDVLVLTSRELWGDYLEGSFQSFTWGKLNLIVTFDPQFYDRILATQYANDPIRQYMHLW